MILIGEKLNSSIPSTLRAMKESDEEIISLIKAQEAAGAAYLDINTAMFEADELPMMEKIVKLALANSSCGIVLDSPDPKVIEEASKLCDGRGLILNSVTADERIDELAPVAAKLGCGVIVLPMDSDGIPETAEGRLECAKKAIAKLTAAGVDEENIYVDAICETLATLDTNAKTSLETIRLVKENTNAKTTCGLSNVSFGLPKRAFVNAAFVSIAIYNGLDSAIADAMNEELRRAIHSANAVSGLDEYCMEYIGFIRGE